MWGSKSRRIAELEAREVFLRKALDAARGTTVQPAAVSLDWEKLAKQLAKDRVVAARADAREMARLQDVIDGLTALLRRDHRRAELLRRARDRVTAEARRLDAEFREIRRAADLHRLEAAKAQPATDQLLRESRALIDSVGKQLAAAVPTQQAS